MNNSNIRMQVLCALFAAFCAVCSQLTIPIQPVPITLGTFAVLLAGGFLGSRYGLMSIVIYLLLGAAGVPRFFHDAFRCFRYSGTCGRIHYRFCGDGFCYRTDFREIWI